MSQAYEHLNDEQLRNAERAIADQKREREHTKWDAELVGRYFRVIRTPESDPFHRTRFQGDDYVTLEESLAVGRDDRYVYGDVTFIHIQSRDDNELTCSGFSVSHAHRREPYLKIQPVFYSWADFRNYLNSWGIGSGGPTKHCDEISKEEYVAALAKAVSNFVDLEGREE